MCPICGRENCCYMFHSEEEQDAFAPAKDAFDRFVAVHEECVERLMHAASDDNAEQAGEWE